MKQCACFPDIAVDEIINLDGQVPAIDTLTRLPLADGNV